MKNDYENDLEREGGYKGSSVSGTLHPSHGRAIASIIIGGGTLLLIWLKFIVFFFSFIFIGLTIVGIVLAVSARKRNALAGYSTLLGSIGLALNIVALAVHSFFLIACSACAAFAFSLFQW